MYRSIPGLTNAFQSISNAQIPLNPEKKRSSWRLNHSLETASIDELPRKEREKKQKELEVNQYYSEIEQCAARIAGKLREIDNIDLRPAESQNSGVSNQKRFLEDQCLRAQSVLPTEFLMRKLNAHEVNQEIIEIDERITFNARNWKSSLMDMGFKESDIEANAAQNDLTPAKRKTINKKATTTAPSTTPLLYGKPPLKPQGSTVKYNFIVPEKERDLDDMNLEELDKFNDDVYKKMSAAFSFDTIQLNEDGMDGAILQKCIKFRDNCTTTTKRIIDKKKREIKDMVTEKESIIRQLELQIPSLRHQNEEADAIINSKNDADRELRAIVEHRYKPTLNQLNEHTKRITDKLSVVNSEYRVSTRLTVKIREMSEELTEKRYHADPFMRKRAENLVKGLLRNLNENDMRIQEEREALISTNYKKWKECKDFISTSRQRLEILENQCTAMAAEVIAQEERIAAEKIEFRDKSRVLRAEDEEVSEKKRRLEEIIADKARNERRAQILRSRQTHQSTTTNNINSINSKSHDDGDGGDDDEYGLDLDSADNNSMTATDRYIKMMEKKYRHVISAHVLNEMESNSGGGSGGGMNNNINIKSAKKHVPKPPKEPKKKKKLTFLYKATAAELAEAQAEADAEAQEQQTKQTASTSKVEISDNLDDKSGVFMDDSVLSETGTSNGLKSKDLTNTKAGEHLSGPSSLHLHYEHRGDSDNSDGDSDDDSSDVGSDGSSDHDNYSLSELLKAGGGGGGTSGTGGVSGNHFQCDLGSAENSTCDRYDDNDNDNDQYSAHKSSSNSGGGGGGRHVPDNREMRHQTRLTGVAVTVPVPTSSRGGSRRSMMRGGRSRSPPKTPQQPPPERPDTSLRPLCDPLTETILDLSVNQAKRQELTKTKKLIVAVSPMYHQELSGGKVFTIGDSTRNSPELGLFQPSLGDSVTSTATAAINVNARVSPTTVSFAPLPQSQSQVNQQGLSDSEYRQVHSIAGAVMSANNTNIQNKQPFSNSPTVQTTRSSILRASGNHGQMSAAIAGPQSQFQVSSSTTTHSIIATACYTDLCQRDNLAADGSNRRIPVKRQSMAHFKSFESDIVPDVHAIVMAPASNKRSTNIIKKYHNSSNYQAALIKKYSGYSFTIAEGVRVLENCIYALSSTDCMEKEKMTQGYKNLDRILANEKLCCTVADEDEVRYKLHVTTVTLIHNVLVTAPKTVLVTNSRRLFIDTLHCLFALVGVVLNCSLYNWSPPAATVAHAFLVPSDSSSSHHAPLPPVSGFAPIGSAGIAPRTGAVPAVISTEKIELVCSQIVELVIANGDVDNPQSSNNTMTNKTTATAIYKRRQCLYIASKNKHRAHNSVTSPLTVVDEIAEQLESEAEKSTMNFIEYLRGSAEYLLQPPPGITSTVTAAATTTDKSNMQASSDGTDSGAKTSDTNVKLSEEDILREMENECKGDITTEEQATAVTAEEESTESVEKAFENPLLVAINAEIDAILFTLSDNVSGLSTNTNRVKNTALHPQLKECVYTMKHRNALYGIQLLLLVACNERKFTVYEVQEMFARVLKEGERLGEVKDAVVDHKPVLPTDFDELLLQIRPQIMPAIYAIELLKRTIEEEISRARFLNKIAESAAEVADLQHLNVALPAHVDLDIAGNARQTLGRGSVVGILNRGAHNNVSTATTNSVEEETETGTEAENTSTLAGSTAPAVAVDITATNNSSTAEKPHQDCEPLHAPAITVPNLVAVRNDNTNDTDNGNQSTSLHADVAPAAPAVPPQPQLNVHTLSVALIPEENINNKPTKYRANTRKLSSVGGSLGTSGKGSFVDCDINSSSITSSVNIGSPQSQLQQSVVFFDKLASTRHPSISQSYSQQQDRGTTDYILAAMQNAVRAVEHSGNTGGHNRGSSMSTSVGTDSLATSAVPDTASSLAATVDSMQTNHTVGSTVKEVHFSWLKDIEAHVLNLSRQIHTLVWNPTSLTVNTMTTTVNGGGVVGRKTNQPHVMQHQQDQNATIPLPDNLIYRLLSYVEAVQNICNAHYSDGEERVLQLAPLFQTIMDELRINRGKILRIVSALTWPMKKRLNWLRTKYNKAMEETSIVTKQITEKRNVILHHRQNKDQYKSSLHTIEHEKCLAQYKKTKQLQLLSHPPDIQQILLDHTTRENYNLLASLKSKEALLLESLRQFQQDFNHLGVQFNRLSIAHRSVNPQAAVTIVSIEDNLDSVSSAQQQQPIMTSPPLSHYSDAGTSNGVTVQPFTGNSIGNNAVGDKTSNNNDIHSNNSYGENNNGNDNDNDSNKHSSDDQSLRSGPQMVPPTVTMSAFDSFMQVERLSDILSSITGDISNQMAMEEEDDKSGVTFIEDADDAYTLQETLSNIGMRTHVRKLRQEQREKVNNRYGASGTVSHSAHSTHSSDKDKQSNFNETRRFMRASGHQFASGPKPLSPAAFQHFATSNRKPILQPVPAAAAAAEAAGASVESGESDVLEDEGNPKTAGVTVVGDTQDDMPQKPVSYPACKLVTPRLYTFPKRIDAGLIPADTNDAEVQPSSTHNDDNSNNANKKRANNNKHRAVSVAVDGRDLYVSGGGKSGRPVTTEGRGGGGTGKGGNLDIAEIQRNFLMYAGGMDFDLAGKRERGEAESMPSSNTAAEGPSDSIWNDLSLQGCAKPQSERKTKIPINKDLAEKKTFFLEELRRLAPFRFADLYPPAEPQENLTPLDLIKMLNIQLPPPNARKRGSKMNRSHSAGSSGFSGYRYGESEGLEMGEELNQDSTYDDMTTVDGDNHHRIHNADGESWKSHFPADLTPLPMQVIINFKPRNLNPNVGTTTATTSVGSSAAVSVHASRAGSGGGDGTEGGHHSASTDFRASSNTAAESADGSTDDGQTADGVAHVKLLHKHYLSQHKQQQQQEQQQSLDIEPDKNICSGDDREELTATQVEELADITDAVNQDLQASLANIQYKHGTLSTVNLNENALLAPINVDEILTKQQQQQLQSQRKKSVVLREGSVRFTPAQQSLISNSNGAVGGVIGHSVQMSGGFGSKKKKINYHGHTFGSHDISGTDSISSSTKKSHKSRRYKAQNSSLYSHSNKDAVSLLNLQNLANNNELFRWENADLFQGDDEVSFKGHKYKFEEDPDFVTSNATRSHTLVNTAQGETKNVLETLSILTAKSPATATTADNKSSPKGNHAKHLNPQQQQEDETQLLNSQVQELLKSKVTVVRESILRKNSLISGGGGENNSGGSGDSILDPISGTTRNSTTTDHTLQTINEESRHDSSVVAIPAESEGTNAVTESRKSSLSFSVASTVSATSSTSSFLSPVAVSSTNNSFSNVSTAHIIQPVSILRNTAIHSTQPQQPQQRNEMGSSIADAVASHLKATAAAAALKAAGGPETQNPAPVSPRHAKTSSFVSPRKVSFAVQKKQLGML